MDLATMTEEERRRWEDLDPEQQAFVLAREPLWRRASRIAAENPGVDVGDVFHALSSWEETPAERLRRSFRRARLLSRTR